MTNTTNHDSLDSSLWEYSLNGRKLSGVAAQLNALVERLEEMPTAHDEPRSDLLENTVPIWWNCLKKLLNMKSC